MLELVVVCVSLCVGRPRPSTLTGTREHANLAHTPLSCVSLADINFTTDSLSMSQYEGPSTVKHFFSSTSVHFICHVVTIIKFE